MVKQIGNGLKLILEIFGAYQYLHNSFKNIVVHVGLRELVHFLIFHKTLEPGLSRGCSAFFWASKKLQQPEKGRRCQENNQRNSNAWPTKKLRNQGPSQAGGKRMPAERRLKSMREREVQALAYILFGCSTFGLVSKEK